MTSRRPPDAVPLYHPAGCSVTGSHPAGMLVLLPLGAWTALYIWRGLAAHRSFHTNAYDLSVFDYALWSLAHGAHGYVPFMGHSIFSHHFMPLLYALAPLHAVAPSAVTLITLQIAAVAAAGYLYFLIQRHIGLSDAFAVVLMLVFLLSRRSHSATTSFFYPESFQPVFIFGCVLFWLKSRHVAYWVCAVLLLMTKEDAGVYLGAFAVVMLITNRSRVRQALLTSALCGLWILAALTVAIPSSREADGLTRDNVVVLSRYAEDGDVRVWPLASRLGTPEQGSNLTNLMLATGFLPLAGFSWCLPAIPGMVANMVASPDSMQAALIGHYAFPILPWLFLGAAFGLGRVRDRFPRGAWVWCTMLLIGTVIDSPAIRGIASTRGGQAAVAARSQLPTQISERTVVWAQPNLVPHLPYSSRMYTMGLGPAPPSAPDLVLLTLLGTLWPFTEEDVREKIGEFRRNPEYRERVGGPVFVFERNQVLSRLPSGE